MVECRVDVVDHGAVAGLLRAVKVDVELPIAVIMCEPARIVKLSLKDVKCTLLRFRWLAEQRLAAPSSARTALDGATA